MAFVYTFMGWLGGWVAETAFKIGLDKVLDNMKEPCSQGEGGVGDALNNLKTSLNNIQPTIDRAENMLTKDQGLRENVNEMLLQLKDTTYDAEDLLDKFEFRKLQIRINQQSNKAGNSSSSSSSVWSRPMKKRKIGEDNDQDDVTEIWRIQEKLEEIGLNTEKLLNRLNLLRSSDNRYMQNISKKKRVTTSYPIETKLFGRDKEQKDLMKLLLEPDQIGSEFGSSNKISILTITGMGGVGKTTVAQEVYNDERVKEHFKLRIWVCVSEDFDEERLTKQIIESATGRTYNLKNLDALQGVVNENVASKKFLLVLDDVWNEDSCKWDRRMWDNLCAPLRYAVIGSKILVTTRDKKIPKLIGSVHLIHLGCLDYDDCFSFFKKCAFGSENPKDHPQLEAVAKEMVPKLKGLPLAAKTLGGLLNMNMDEQHWRTIMDSEIWKLPQEENGVLLVLQLSYLYLPAHLKRCFAFCSLFHKDYKFTEDELVSIWMAEGFFPSQENIRMEDFGSQCFHELVNRSFFQNTQDLYLNRYVMHDLIHDLAQMISGGETYRLEDGKQVDISTTPRHIKIVRFIDDKELSAMMGSNYFIKLRTFICGQQFCWKNSMLICQSFKTLQTVRTLILVECRLTEIPESIGDLFYLRYLDISCSSKLKELPESLCSLSNLQTLMLYGCFGLQSLPQGMSKLINLRKLSANDDLVSKITGVGKLTSLQSLFIFKVRKEQGHKLAELGGLTQLHGKLKITGLENVENKDEAIAANLQSKVHLDELVFEWTIDRDNDAFIISEEVLEHLQPNSTLKRLEIGGYNGVKSPSWLEAKSLSRLETLRLYDCKRWDDFSFIRNLSHLKSLVLNRLTAVTRISQDCDDNCLLLPPSIKILVLSDCEKVSKSLPGCIDNLTFLVELKLNNCPHLVTLPRERLLHLERLAKLTLQNCSELTSIEGLGVLKSLEFLEICECPKLQVNEEDGRGENIFLQQKVFLCIDHTSLLKVWPLRNMLPSIDHLFIGDSQEMNMLEGEDKELFRSLTSLKFLDFHDCMNLQFLPTELHALPSLECLEIHRCPQIQSLPEKGLPISLKDISYYKCHPTLQEQIKEYLMEMKNSVSS